MGSEFQWSSDYVEGNAWHYVWYVPYDVAGMIDLQHGGDTDAFLERLSKYWDEVEAEPDDLLPDNWYWHGNEPVLHYAALGSLAGDRALSARAADWIATHRYSAAPTGLDGNDDAGTLSAWYAWTALGVYPIAGTDRYAILSPRFEGVRIRRDDGDVWVTGPGAPAEAMTVKSGGTLLEGGELKHDDLLKGLDFSRP
jgi:putative alpha-1,2-mannosidase